MDVSNRSIEELIEVFGKEMVNAVLWRHSQPKAVSRYVACNKAERYEELREPLFQKMSRKNNVLGKAEMFSRDGKTVQLFRGMRKGQDPSQCMSWSFSPVVARHFFKIWGRKQFGKKAIHFASREDFGAAIEEFVENEFEMRVMTVPLEMIEAVSLYAPHTEHEVLMNVRCAEFYEMFAGCETYKPSEAE